MLAPIRNCLRSTPPHIRPLTRSLPALRILERSSSFSRLARGRRSVAFNAENMDTNQGKLSAHRVRVVSSDMYSLPTAIIDFCTGSLLCPQILASRIQSGNRQVTGIAGLPPEASRAHIVPPYTDSVIVSPSSITPIYPHGTLAPPLLITQHPTPTLSTLTPIFRRPRTSRSNARAYFPVIFNCTRGPHAGYDAT